MSRSWTSMVVAAATVGLTGCQSVHPPLSPRLIADTGNADLWAGFAADPDRQGPGADGAANALAEDAGGAASDAAYGLQGMPGGKLVLRYLTVRGKKRSYLLGLPGGKAPRNPAGLVIGMHGGMGNGEQFADSTNGLADAASREGWIAVFPNGTGQLGGTFPQETRLTWNASATCCGWAQERDVDDVGFLGALIDQLKRDYRIDAARVFATGMSNGGAMSYRLAQDLSGSVAAIAPVSGPSGGMENVAPGYLPVAVLAIHGTADGHAPYFGGYGASSAEANRLDAPVPWAVAYWAVRNGLSLADRRVEEVATAPGGLAVRRYLYGRLVEHYQLVGSVQDGAGHAWPGGKPGRAQAEPPAREISANDLIVRFFKGHSRTSSRRLHAAFGGLRVTSERDTSERTGDGLAFRNAQAGVFTALKTSGGTGRLSGRADSLLVQKTQGRLGRHGNVVVNAIAVQAGQHIIRYDVAGKTVTVDGSALSPGEWTRNLGNAGLTFSAGTLSVTSPVGDQIVVADRGTWLDMTGVASLHRLTREASGLQGALGTIDADSTFQNDLVMRNGAQTSNLNLFLRDWMTAPGEQL